MRPPRFFQCLAHRRYVRGELTDLSLFWRCERSRHGERKLKDEALLSTPTARRRLKDKRTHTTTQAKAKLIQTRPEFLDVRWAVRCVCKSGSAPRRSTALMRVKRPQNLVPPPASQTTNPNHPPCRPTGHKTNQSASQPASQPASQKTNQASKQPTKQPTNHTACSNTQNGNPLPTVRRRNPRPETGAVKRSRFRYP